MRRCCSGRTSCWCAEQGFDRLARKTQIVVDSRDDTPVDELRARALPEHHSNGAAERAEDCEGVIGERVFCLRNAGRTASMLELVRLGLNRTADELVSSRHRNYLVAGGSPGGQMSTGHRKGQPSLRPYELKTCSAVKSYDPARRLFVQPMKNVTRPTSANDTELRNSPSRVVVAMLWDAARSSTTPALTTPTITKATPSILNARPDHLGALRDECTPLDAGLFITLHSYQRP